MGQIEKQQVLRGVPVGGRQSRDKLRKAPAESARRSAVHVKPASINRDLGDRDAAAIPKSTVVER